MSIRFLALATSFVAFASAVAAPSIDFTQQVQPILAEHCFACHGPDAKARKADLRLDTPEGIKAAINSAKLSDSELLKRIAPEDPDDLMPPKKFNKPLKPDQVALLRQWVEQGAKWDKHWSLVAPKKGTLPAVKNPAWPKTFIDKYILARLDAQGLTPNPEVTKTALLRRVSLDLTGLPPTPAEVDAFLKDTSTEAYSKAVDRLVASDRFGEHMARYWLDAARYGDTHGLHLDNYREMWPYREWVIRAFNQNKRFDQFLTEQIAGDLLPSPTTDQLIATGFLRAHVTTSEGGSIEEEVYVRNVDDRVDTFGSVMLGYTVGCAKCHDHKYDPVTQKDYYSLFAFFNSLEGPSLDRNIALPPPFVRVKTPEAEKQIAKLKEDLAAIDKEIAAALAKVDYKDDASAPVAKKPKRADYVWLDDALPAGAKPLVGGQNLAWNFVAKKDIPVESGDKAVKLTATGLQQNVVQPVSPPLRTGAGDMLFAYVYLDPKSPPEEIMLQWHTSGWLHRAYWGANKIPWGRDNSTERKPQGKLPETGKWVRLEVKIGDVGIKPGTEINGFALTQFGGTAYWDKAGIATLTPQGEGSYDSLTEWANARGADTSLPAAIRDILKLDPGKRSESQQKQVRDYFIEHAYSKTRDIFKPLHKKREAIGTQITQIESKLPATLIYKEMEKPKPAYVLNRGEYDQRKEQVGRETPGALPPLGATPQAATRLDLAKWLVSKDHPLTARVAVNRFWQQFFGTGLVKTADDFGTQGERPSHPLLLDHLAVEFRESGWDVKKLVKTIVMSAAYRQSAKVTPEKLAKDPQNRLLSRGPRFRLDAEVVRDQALYLGDLLVEKLGGPSVKPPQPPGLWEAVGYTSSNTAKFTADSGPDKVYRRSIYTFWKRTSPPPQMSALDAPSREACIVRRERTNTPLQALLLMNETQFVEAARGMAKRAIKEGGAKAEDRVAYLFKLGTCRNPDEEEKAILLAAFNEHVAKFKANAQAPKKLAGDSKDDVIELAALTMVANLVLNLDEVLTK